MITTMAVGRGDAVVMIMGVWLLRDVTPSPKPPRPPPPPAAAASPGNRPIISSAWTKRGNPGGEPCGNYEESRRSWKYRRRGNWDPPDHDRDGRGAGTQSA